VISNWVYLGGTRSGYSSLQALVNFSHKFWIKESDQATTNFLTPPFLLAIPLFCGPQR
jgi:hypothetical protein